VAGLIGDDWPASEADPGLMFVLRSAGRNG
jgi:hypothetical protein